MHKVLGKLEERNVSSIHNNARRRAPLEPRRTEPAISQCSSVFDFSSPSLSIAMAAGRGEKKNRSPSQCSLQSHRLHQRTLLAGARWCDLWLLPGQLSALWCLQSRKNLLSFTLNVQLALTTLSSSHQQSNLCEPCFLGHLPTQDSYSPTALAPGIKHMGTTRSFSSLPAEALLQLDLHLNAALSPHSDHLPDLCGVPTLPWDQECTECKA